VKERERAEEKERKYIKDYIVLSSVNITYYKRPLYIERLRVVTKKP